MRGVFETAVLFSFLGLFLPSASQAEEKIDDAWVAKALDEGGKALAKRRALLDGLDETDESRPSAGSLNPRGTLSTTTRSVRKGAHTLIEKKRTYSDQAKQPTITVECENADYTFELGKSSEQSAFALTKYSPVHERKESIARFAGGLHVEVFYHLEGALAALESEKRKHLKRVQYDAPSATLVVEWTVEVKGGRVQERLVLAPTKGWVVLERSAETPKAVASSKYEYGREIEGGPFPTITSSTAWLKEEPNKIARGEVRVLKLERTKLQDSDFRLAAFGLPEPADVKPLARPTPWYLWLLAVAGGAVTVSAGSAALRRYLKRQAASLPS